MSQFRPKTASFSAGIGPFLVEMGPFLVEIGPNCAENDPFEPKMDQN